MASKLGKKRMFRFTRSTDVYGGLQRRCQLEKLEVIIHSSSHLGSHRGVAEGLRLRLSGEFNVHIISIGGRKWDEGLIKDFLDLSHDKPVLHIILLGDNDLRGTKQGDQVNPWIKKFGKAVKGHRDLYDKHTVFVNGLLPFPMHGRPDSNELIENYFRYTRDMYMLTKEASSIYYIPMREGMMEYCKEKKLMAEKLFRQDKVHLNKIGEGFLIKHLVRQARMYKAALGLCVKPTDLTFFQNVACYHRSDEENLSVMTKEYRVTSVLTKNF